MGQRSCAWVWLVLPPHLGTQPRFNISRSTIKLFHSVTAIVSAVGLLENDRQAIQNAPGDGRLCCKRHQRGGQKVFDIHDD